MASDKEEKKTTTKDMDSTRCLMAALSYLNVLFLIPLLFAKKDKYVKLHLRQGIVLFAAYVIVSAVVWFPVIGWMLGLFLLVISIYGFLQALSGKEWELPYIGKYASKIRI
ncbi:MAG: hypothetical protein U9Q03_06275 [Patescibacteria group bacterium]|nr:hypothetical protein [Patescibacteria group bacterium]